MVECFHCNSAWDENKTVEFKSSDGRRITFCNDCADSLEREGVIKR